MRSSGITLIAEERAAHRRRARMAALKWIVVAAMSLGAIYVSEGPIGSEPQTTRVVQR
jgi:hypothetical protein